MSKYIRNKKIIKRDIAGQIILVPLVNNYQNKKKTGKLFVLNQTSNFIWDFLKEEKSEEEVVVALLDNFTGVGRKEIEKDVKEVLQILVDKNLVFKIK
jgi:hypothetical protein